MRWSYRAVLSGVVIVTGCGGDRDRDQPSRDTSGIVPPAGPGGMGMGHMDSAGRARMRARMTPGMRAHMDSMMGMSREQMRAHMDSMMRMSPQQRRARMAEHQRMMTRMMDMMSSDTGMPMSGDPAWRALKDSLRADLAALPRLEGEELATRLREHTKRVERLLVMHGPMMGN